MAQSGDWGIEVDESENLERQKEKPTTSTAGSTKEVGEEIQARVGGAPITRTSPW